MSPVHRHLPPRPITAIRFDGGRPCLDFVNTIHDRYAVEVEDNLQQPQRFIEWCGRAGVLRPDDGVWCAMEPAASPTRCGAIANVDERLLVLGIWGEC